MYIARLHDLLQVATTARQFVDVADVVAAGACVDASLTLGPGSAGAESDALRATLAMHAVGAGGGPMGGHCTNGTACASAGNLKTGPRTRHISNEPPSGQRRPPRRKSGKPQRLWSVQPSLVGASGCRG